MHLLFMTLNTFNYFDINKFPYLLVNLFVKFLYNESETLFEAGGNLITDAFLKHLKMLLQNKFQAHVIRGTIIDPRHF